METDEAEIDSGDDFDRYPGGGLKPAQFRMVGAYSGGGCVDRDCKDPGCGGNGKVGKAEAEREDEGVKDAGLLDHPVGKKPLGEKVASIDGVSQPEAQSRQMCTGENVC